MVMFPFLENILHGVVSILVGVSISGKFHVFHCGCFAIGGGHIRGNIRYIIEST